MTTRCSSKPCGGECLTSYMGTLQDIRRTRVHVRVGLNNIQNHPLSSIKRIIWLLSRSRSTSSTEVLEHKTCINYQVQLTLISHITGNPPRTKFLITSIKDEDVNLPIMAPEDFEAWLTKSGLAGHHSNWVRFVYCPLTDSFIATERNTPG